MEKEKNVRTEGNVNGEESRDRAVRIGSLWNRTAEDGRNYKSGVVDFGHLGELHVAPFREEKKNADGDDENESKKPDFVLICEKNRIGAFWLRMSKSGKSFLSGSILGVPVNIFRNEKKQNDRAPDYRIVKFTEATEETAEDEDF